MIGSSSAGSNRWDDSLNDPKLVRLMSSFCLTFFTPLICTIRRRDSATGENRASRIRQH